MMRLLEYAMKRAEAKGAYQAEAYQSTSNEFRVVYEKRQLKIGEHKRDSGIGVRVAFKHDGGISLGFFHTNELTKKMIDTAIEKALKTARIKRPDPDFESFQEMKTFGKINKIYDKKILELEPKGIMDLAKLQIEVAVHHKKIETTSGFMMAGEYETSIANSLGIEGSFKTTNFYSYCSALAREGDSLGSGWDEHANCFYNETEALKSSENAAKLATEQLHQKSIEGGKMDLIIPPSALMQLMINHIIQMLRADKVQKHQSAFAGKIGQQIGSEILTIIDDGRMAEAVGSKLFDDEGHPTQKTILIEKGVLKNYIYNTYTAHKDGVEGTGNAHRAMIFNVTPKYTLEPLIGPTNVVLKPGTCHQESLIREVKNGIITKGFIGTHTANIASGEFSVVLDSPFKIENGEIRYPVKEAMIGGNALDLLRNIEVIANDTRQFEYNLMAAMIKDATLIAPSILVRNVPVSA